MYHTPGVHHITGITGNPQENLNFYEGFLGQRLIKRTVNFDDPSAYHLYYADYHGTPGTVLTFFYWKHLPPTQPGSGEVSALSYRVASGALSYWEKRAKQYAVETTFSTTDFDESALSFKDPDGLSIHLVESDLPLSINHWEAGPIPKAYALQGFHTVRMNTTRAAALTPVLTDALGYEYYGARGAIERFVTHGKQKTFVDVVEDPTSLQAVQGVGAIHHIAFQADTDADRVALDWQVQELGIATTGLVDRFYFKATYFMTSARILFELSTNDIGFAIDEPVETLGEHLVVPERFRLYKAAIEEKLVPLKLPRTETKNS
jgi:glyoxalase family protein